MGIAWALPGFHARRHEPGSFPQPAQRCGEQHSCRWI